MFSWLIVWVRQPSTIAGLSAIVGSLVAVVQHQLSLGSIMPVIAGAVVSILLPDNASAKQAARELTTDLVGQVNLGAK